MAHSNVLLGIADTSIPFDADKNLTWTTNKFGGVPNWMQDCLPDIYPKCNLCHAQLYHVAQIYCPLEGSKDHRTLNIFGCLSESCMKHTEGWRVLRSQCEVKHCLLDEIAKENVEKSVSDTWCVGADDWGNDEVSSVEDVNAQFQELSMNAGSVDQQAYDDQICSQANKTGRLEKLQPKQTFDINEGIPTFEPHYIHVVDELEVDADDNFDHERNLLRQYEEREGSSISSNSKGNSKEKYEKSQINDGDKQFYQFQKRIRRCPQQCLRYQWDGQPLGFSEKISPSCDFSSIPVCLNCRSERVFEMQLMPNLSWILRKQELDHKSPNQRLEFGTVFIYTCEKSCHQNIDGRSYPVEEFVVLQPFPDQDLIQNFVT